MLVPVGVFEVLDFVGRVEAAPKTLVVFCTVGRGAVGVKEARFSVFGGTLGIG